MVPDMSAAASLRSSEQHLARRDDGLARTEAKDRWKCRTTCTMRLALHEPWQGSLAYADMQLSRNALDLKNVRNHVCAAGLVHERIKLLTIGRVHADAR